MEYNTKREHLLVREYGRNIHNMVRALKKIDTETRVQSAESIIRILEVLNPELKQSDNMHQILWDHLFLIADDTVEIPNSPYPKPPKNFLQKKENLQPLPYPKTNIRFSHMGKNFERLMDYALQEQDKNKQDYLTNVLAFYMKIAYYNWHKEIVHDDSVKSELSTLSKGMLEYPNHIPPFRFKPPSLSNNNNKQKNNNGKNKPKRR